MRPYNKLILAGMAVSASLYLPAMGAFAQPPSEGDLNVLGLLIEVRDADDKCGYLESDERRYVDAMLAEGVRRLGKQGQATLKKLSKPEKVNCSQGSHLGFIELFRAVTAGKLPTTEEDADDEFSVSTLKKQLEKVVGGLPKGRLQPIQGCWQTSFQGWSGKFCFTNGGDELSVQLTAPGAEAVCDLPNGHARRREGKAYFYAFSEKLKCSNGRPIQHLEGLCSDYEKGRMKCLISVFAQANYAFAESPTSEEPLGGEVEMKRSR